MFLSELIYLLQNTASELTMSMSFQKIGEGNLHHYSVCVLALGHKFAIVQH